MKTLRRVAVEAEDLKPIGPVVSLEPRVDVELADLFSVSRSVTIHVIDGQELEPLFTTTPAPPAVRQERLGLQDAVVDPVPGQGSVEHDMTDTSVGPTVIGADLLTTVSTPILRVATFT
jgi:hypothetical protein